MLGKEVFSHPDVQLPLSRSSGDYSTFVAEQLDKYKAVVKAVSGSDALSGAISAKTQEIEDLCDSVQEVIDKFTEGHPYDAYQALANGIVPIKGDLDRLSTDPLQGDTLNMMYRVRQRVSPPLTREELFHVPFELRHCAAPQRYSIQGLPCLYLGGSLYTCWAEMGMPAFSDLQASAFWFKTGKTVRLVDFGHRPRWVARWISKHEALNQGQEIPDNYVNFFASHTVCWPLMAIASVKALHPAAPFKAEYILPQVLLQWVTKQPDIDGIRYFSTHIDCVTDNPHWACNYVFPSRVVKSCGRCDHLRSLFKLTEPTNWQLLRSIHLDSRPGNAMDTFEFEFIKGIREGYHSSEFGQVQITLNSLAMKIQAFNVAQNGDPGLGDVKP
jgi:hypothetical protein